MTLDADSTTNDIYDDLYPPHPEDDDLAAWEIIACGELCGTYGEDGYIYNRAGLFGWSEWDAFVDACTTAAVECADNYDTDNYDGWSAGIVVETTDINVTLDEDEDKLGIVFPDYEFGWFVMN